MPHSISRGNIDVEVFKWAYFKTLFGLEKTWNLTSSFNDEVIILAGEDEEKFSNLVRKLIREEVNDEQNHDS